MRHPTAQAPIPQAMPNQEAARNEMMHHCDIPKPMVTTESTLDATSARMNESVSDQMSETSRLDAAGTFQPIANRTQNPTAIRAQMASESSAIRGGRGSTMAFTHEGNAPAQTMTNATPSR